MYCRKSIIDPTSDEYHQDQNGVLVLIVGADALCTYNNYFKCYSFCCKNENYLHH